LNFKQVFYYTQNLNILYVEDEQAVREETYDVLEDFFSSVQVAHNGLDALVKYKNYHNNNAKHYDLIITDINMPVMDGMQLIREVHTLYQEQSIIVVSAYNESSRLTDLIQEGITKFVMKPIAPLQLMKILYKTAKSIYNQKELTCYQEKLKELNKNLDMKVQLQAEEIIFTQKISIETIANMVENYDDETGAHIKRIEAYSELIVKEVSASQECPKELRDNVPFASLLHDIGKLLIPKHILSKPGKLTDEEFEVIKTHASLGGEVLKRANLTFQENFHKDSFLKIASDIAMYHHEKWNGLGYPKGLVGIKIPMCARIVSIADVYDALRSKRVYKESYSHQKALKIIQNESGKSFDPLLVKVFLSHHEEFDQVFRNFS